MHQRFRHRRQGLVVLSQALLAALLLAVPAEASPVGVAGFLDTAHALHSRLATEVRDGQTSDTQALMIALRAVFAPGELAAEYSRLNLVPLRCATPLVRAASDPGSGLSTSELAQIDAWRHGDLMAGRAGGTVHISPSGRFSIEYWTSGVDSVSVLDVSPANGTPDYVDQVATDLDYSWATEVDGLGFDAPATAGLPYQVQLKSIGSFGLTELDVMAPGGTHILLRNNYDGMPINEDPDGSERGALRVSAAHEFRHACQYATSAWSEAGLWVEVDATWMEDQVFGAVNDYYRFLQSSSPISDPPLPLDSGGWGSYPESVFQHWMQRRLGIGAIRDFWERRRTMPGEDVLESYDSVLRSSWVSLDSAFVDFALFNLQSGSLAGAGMGYPDAAGYPDAKLSADSPAVPVQFGSAIEHLAAKFYRISGFSSGTESVHLRVRQPDGARLRLATLTMVNDGTRVIESLHATTVDSKFELATAVWRIDELYLVVANGASAGAVEWFFVDVEEAPPTAPDPVPVLADAWTTLQVATGHTRNLAIDLQNAGPNTSSLEWSARAVEPDGGAARRSIAGSTLSIDHLAYVPGEEYEFSLGILNGSTGFEFLSGVSLALPPGVALLSGTDFVAEAGLDLAYVGLDSVVPEVKWIDPDGGFGAVPGAGTALATVRLAFDASLTGPVDLDWTLSGDGFGISPHEVSGQVSLVGPSDLRLEILCPDPIPPGFVGESTNLFWFAADPAPVTLELSRDDGQNWTTLVDPTPNDGSWPWPVNGPTSSQARLRVRSGGQVSAASDRFEILAPIPFATISPASGTLQGSEGTGLLLLIDASVLAPGDYTVTVDIRDANTLASTTLDIIVQVSASAVEAPPTHRTRVLGAYPNPFNPATELRFELASRSRVELEIMDLRGRRVRQLLDTTLAAGEHGARWDGLDLNGAAVSSGTYIYRMRVGTREFSGKISLVR